MIKKEKKEKPVLLNFKVTKKEQVLILTRAKKFAGGNVSLWLRHAGLNYQPRKKDLE